MAGALLIAAVAAGVLLPKAVPAMLAPSRVGPALARWLDVLPAATLGALTAMAVLTARDHGVGVDVPAAVAVGVAGLVTATGSARRRVASRLSRRGGSSVP